jgi:hypothetical protein
VKRQIIKTRPAEPYRVARIVIIIVLLALCAWAAYAMWWAPQHLAHAGAARTISARAVALQDFAIFFRNPQSPVDLC